MKVVILADSLAMPRGEDCGSIPPEATYPVLLERLLVDSHGTAAPSLLVRGMHRRTIEDVLKDWPLWVEASNADVAVIHVGVVDCAPRVFLPKERIFVDRMRWRWLKKHILKLAKKHRRRIIIVTMGRVYVPLWKFRRCVEEVVRRAQASDLKALLFVDILTPPEWLEHSSPGFRRNVLAYNRVLYGCSSAPNVRVVSLNKVVSQCAESDFLTIDGIHINAAGHALLAQELASRIEEICGLVEAGGAASGDDAEQRSRDKYVGKVPLSDRQSIQRGWR